MAKLSIEIGAKSGVTPVVNKVKDEIASMGKHVAGILTGYFSIKGAESGIEMIITGLAGIQEAAERLSMGDKIEEFQALNFAANQTGAGLDKLEVGMKKMETLIGKAITEPGGDAQKTINGIGLAVADLANMSPDQQFSAIAGAIREIHNPAERAASLVAIFGKSGLSLLPMIENLEALKKEAHDSGVIISTEMVASAHLAEKQFDQLKTVLMATAADTGLVKFISDVADALLKAATNGERLKNLGGGTAKESTTKKENNFGYGFFDEYIGVGMMHRNTLNNQGKSEQIGRLDYTPEDLKKLNDFRDKKTANGDKKNDEIKAIEAAAQAQRVADEAEAAALEKQAKKEAEIEAKFQQRIDEKLTGLKEEQAVQELVNQGKEREAAIQKEIYSLNKDARSIGKTITVDVQNKAVESAGNVFDIEKQTKNQQKQAEHNVSFDKEIQSMRDAIAVQELINQGKEREAFIQQKLLEGQKALNGEMSAKQAADLRDSAGQMYDTKQAMPRDIQPQAVNYVSDSALRIGGFHGGQAQYGGANDIQRQQLDSSKKLESITKEIMSKMPAAGTFNQDDNSNSIGYV